MSRPLRWDFVLDCENSSATVSAANSKNALISVISLLEKTS